MPFDFLCCVRPGVEDIVELDYSHHSLTDVPTEVFVYERTLETLLCQSNRITELPRQLFMCHGLKYLDLSDNELQAIPTAISSLVNLQHLNLSRNTLASIPDNMKSLKNLMFLDLSVNPLEKLPETITNLIAMQDLYLNDTYLEYLPGNFGRLANLRILELRDNYLMILPKSLSRSTDLLRLDIGQNEFQQFPEVIGRFSKLKELWIDSNSFTIIPAVIKPLDNLIHLEASNNMIEELAPEIGYCSRLEDLTLSVNSLTQLPDTIGQLSNLTALKLDNNRLYSIPESIGQLKNLEELMLMSNYIDKLPSSIGLLRKLQYLNVDENMLRVIPPEIGSCAKLSVLSVRSNKLTKIPPEIGHLTSLRVLNLVRNSLSYLPQSLLNCDNLVALWLSENQSKPLVPMHSEVDPNTYEQVLTCFLFPQVPLTPIDIKLENVKSEAQSVPRHISFVDMKPAVKTNEKPGQLRRAPTPYPKELRAMAKHARNIHKDGTQDVPPPMQNAVHIKAAKITPTLQQRFASDNKTDINNINPDSCNVQDPMKVSVYDNLPPENTYDKPLDLNYEEDKTYKSVDHALYSDNNTETISYKDENVDTCGLGPSHYAIKQNERYSPRQEITRSSSSLVSNNYRSHAHENKNYPMSGEHSYQCSDDTCNQIQRLSVSSHERHSREETILSPQFHENSYGTRCRIDNLPHFEPMYARKESVCHPENNYHTNTYTSDALPCGSEKIYPPKNYDVFNYHPHVGRDLSAPRVHTVSHMVSSTTMPNMCNYNNMYPPPNVDTNHYNALHQTASTNCNIYDMSASSPTYVQSQSPELYSPTGHTNATNPYRMTNTPLISDDGSFPHVQPISSHNMYEIYDAMPASSNTPSVVSHRHSPSGLSETVYMRGQPPPYHIAAPYTKHAQYFNGTGG
ncbi:leucine-rich repeat-containing protein 1-like [Danaus plexippus]|uniref:leucine-rich repeat-containing protein 1-like n=1 Tax=Danaus plexippus TaxID=13037 RepID=UPI002AAFD608|nr:leucine-rich repeat-containing protein 1-like [Danaus plexippus]